MKIDRSLARKAVVGNAGKVFEEVRWEDMN